VIRRTSRLVVVSPRKTFLLMMTQAPDSSGFSRWITPGGGVDPGESHLEAARRELFEETGRELPIDEDPVWRYEFDVSWDQASHNRGYAEYFLAFAEEEFEPVSDFWTPEEHIDVTASAWWSVTDLAQTADPYEPVMLPELFQKVLDGHRALSPVLLSSDQQRGSTNEQ
jgi:8-oxo-dGTP pyrophosphatase MutT (NUDIX family)